MFFLYAASPSREHHVLRSPWFSFRMSIKFSFTVLLFLSIPSPVFGVFVVPHGPVLFHALGRIPAFFGFEFLPIITVEYLGKSKMPK